MLKLNAAYSKKVPAEQDYSSQSYHCSIEAELPDGLTAAQLQERIHSTFDLVRTAVEAELNGTAASITVNPMQNHPGNMQLAIPAAVNQNVQQVQQVQQMQQAGHTATANQNQAAHTRSFLPASPKQINYLLNLAKKAGWTIQNILDHCQVNRLEDLEKRICSKLIEQLSGRVA